MGPKKEVKKTLEVVLPSIDSPVNTDEWRCAVVMAVEKSDCDSFVLKEFEEEASIKCRRDVNLISYDHLVSKILQDFINGELPFKYSYLLQFSPIFQEAAEYVKSKLEIPVPLLVKVVKVLLYFYREESIQIIATNELGPKDPVTIMMERPYVGGVVSKEPKSNVNKKEQRSKIKAKNQLHEQNGGIKLRPPSLSKEGTKLLRRGERAKETIIKCIDDAPCEGYFNLYVLLTGFYHPEFPTELIKAQVPLYQVLCIDTNFSGVKNAESSNFRKSQKKYLQPKPYEIQLFWDEFLKILWSPKESILFKEVIFQKYSPRKLECEQKKRREFIYREISYLMYDLSDYKKHHLNYLKNMKLWNVAEENEIEIKKNSGFINYELPNECITVPVVLQNLLNILSEKSEMDDLSISYAESIDSRSDTVNSVFPESVMPESPYTTVVPIWSQIIKESGNLNNSKVYSKLKELDIKYYICEDNFKSVTIQKQNSRERSHCNWGHQKISENLAQAFDCNEMFASYWNKYKKNGCLRNSSFSAVMDYSLYVLLASKVTCPFEEPKLKPLPKNSASEKTLFKKNSSFELIKNLEKEIRTPHFTVTDCSRNIVKCIPWNLKNSNRDFFCPQKFKVVTPEKVKTSSAPEFHLPPCFINEASFISDFVISDEAKETIKWTVYEDLTNFSGNICENLNANGFNFVEELNKAKLLQKKQKYWNEFNCIDHMYSVLTDSIFIKTHNKKNPNSFFSETFNQSLKSNIGLRDFFEYILDDESNWIADQEKLSEKKNPIIDNNVLFKNSFDGYSDSDFWLENSIKFQEYLKLTGSILKIKKDDYFKNKSTGNKEIVKLKSSEKISDTYGSITRENSTLNEKDENNYYFEGYNVDEVAVQFSGIKTEYFVQDCCMTVDLLERLYGKQHLGIHVRHGGHTLHLYSYVCPEPHITLPYTFHLTYKNGIVLAFGQRFLKETIETQEIEKQSTDFASESNEILKNYKIREDDRFAYDLKLSIPNGLIVEVVPKMVNPCYIKQYFLDQSISDNDVKDEESCRIFLPNGNLILLKKDNTFNILKGNTSIVSASLNSIVKESFKNSNNPETFDKKLILDKYDIITPMSYHKIIENGVVKSSRKIQLYEQIDIESNQIFFRRTDGTNYVIKNDGSICVQFKDKTKISRCPFFGKELIKNDTNENTDSPLMDSDEIDFIFVYEEIIIEHPSYATVMYNSQCQEWKIILPDESKITVEKDGYYSVNVDERTNMKIDKDFIHMNRYSSELNLICHVIVNSSVFFKKDENDEKIYCQMVNLTSGETFIVESNSVTYILQSSNEKEIEQKNNMSETIESHSRSDRKINNYQSENVKNIKGNELSFENKYFVLRKDFTGFQILHENDVRKTLFELNKGTLVYVQELDELKKLRCFVAISPVSAEYFQQKIDENVDEWKTKSIIPDPVNNSKNSVTEISSTYGVPPSWMHPFPKKRKKFAVPENLTCSVFIETVKTDLEPGNGCIDYFFCEHVDLDDGNLWKTNSGDIKKDDFIKRLSDDDQILLKKMYSRLASKLINEKKNSRSFNQDLLNRYLKMSKYYVELRDYHKHSIRYHIIPNYFHHPAGMSWLLIDGWVNELKLTKSKTKLTSSPEIVSIDSLKSHSTFSNEEVEYNLSWPSIKSFSDLSWHSNLSAKTGPATLHQKNVCTCKVRPVRDTVSAPLHLFKDKINESVENFEMSQNRLQLFSEYQDDAFKNVHTEKKSLPSSTFPSSPSSLSSPPSLPSPSPPPPLSPSSLSLSPLALSSSSSSSSSPSSSSLPPIILKDLMTLGLI